ncbi:transporter substrate-binding domain-containing protein [Streptomyces termitum]|uniref:Amino acid ABC transporter substrate-binding protein n=1 Tax=Streptomyces termitum TaxID=67368 RepID=A0A918SYC8_9ACTN|nr:transporter substrate-binding domain-containing protein [Streptomyces termitum]GHA75988.1 amino acid ABC transporter substrate-binding protein [Streptomyces termitum]
MSAPGPGTGRRTAAAPGGPTLAAVRARGALRAVVSRGVPGLSARSADGVWSGLDTDVARAVAAAALGDAGAVEWVPAAPADRLAVLADGGAELTVANTTWTMGREAAWPILFAAVTCYDGEGFLVRTADGITSAAGLAGRAVAVQAGTTSAANLAAWYGPRGLAVRVREHPTPAGALAAYAGGACAALVLDRVALAGQRALLPVPGDHLVLAETISREPMAAAVREDDPAWLRLCRWVVNVLLAAEHEVAGAPAEGGGRAAALERVAAAAGRHGPAAGLDPRWAARVLAAVGTYADVYERALGPASGLDVPRGLNELWTGGGLHHPVPLY